ncbi:transposable element Tcb2 transposase [Trichonephila clavipes]|nr:transposable element Tcb2 transposase [Trichonephila clavipes]
MDDNARPHWTLAVEELLESEDITRIDWPAYSPDLNPIEHVWDALGRRIAARLHHPGNTQQLKHMLIEEWSLLPQEMLHQLVQSMRRRCEATIATGVSNTKSSQANASDHGRHALSLSPVPLKTHRLGQRCTLKLSKAETFSRWCGVVVRRECQLRCRSRHLTMVQNYEVRRQKPSCS